MAFRLRPSQEVTLPLEDESRYTSARGLVTVRDAKCWHCGFVAGQLVLEADPLHPRRFLRVSGQCPADLQVVDGQLRCCRCGGPLYLDDVETVVRLRMEAVERPRRGRKPKGRPSEPPGVPDGPADACYN